ncbi:MAG: hypothetical protein M1820_004731 [Bogoriella megaspora]|nr:MAG: hypothetical protein M1820_004731 [Bogoriella megaspora]
MGGSKPWPQVPVGNKDHTNAAVLIIGAGISGNFALTFCCTIKRLLKSASIEKSSGVGGTWNDNKYPGCSCDVWSLLYSYSFDQNPDWSREYPGQEEILDYLVDVAQKYNLYKYIRFNTAVDEARWNDSNKKWETSVTVSGTKDAEFSPSYTISSYFLVSAVGQLNSPSYPSIPGLDTFQGKVMHSARWDWSYDLTGKRVAVIGNGGTSAQIVPEIANTAKSVTVYQRTPNWIVPRFDREVSTFEKVLFRYLPYTRLKKRAWQMDFRESFFDAVWDNSSQFAEQIRKWCREGMEAALKDKPELWDVLTPKYSPGCKRILMCDDYYASLARDNVHLETRPISSITPTGISVASDSFAYPASFQTSAPTDLPFDALVLATGFRTTEFLRPISITGTHSVPLSDLWSGGAHALYGITVPQLPNFAMLYGPNTNLGHNSIVLMIEAQSRYISTLIAPILDARKEGKTLTIAPREDVTQKYDEEVQRELGKSSFADPRCGSWYKNQEGRITNNWKGTVVEYQKLVEEVRWGEYEVEGEGKGVRLGEKTRIGRVKEESQVSDRVLLGLSLLSAGAVIGGMGLAWRYAGRLRRR